MLQFPHDWLLNGEDGPFAGGAHNPAWRITPSVDRRMNSEAAAPTSGFSLAALYYPLNNRLSPSHEI
jgi:hypothetical protein